MQDIVKDCPKCGESIRSVARKCRYCGEYFDPADRPAAEPPDGLDRFLTPEGTHWTAIAAGYFGLFSFFPIIGVGAGPLAVGVGLLALKVIKNDPSLVGRGRALFGIITGGSMAILQWGVLIAMMLRIL